MKLLLQLVDEALVLWYVHSLFCFWILHGHTRCVFSRARNNTTVIHAGLVPANLLFCLLSFLSPTASSQFRSCFGSHWHLFEYNVLPSGAGYVGMIVWTLCIIVRSKTGMCSCHVICDVRKFLTTSCVEHVEHFLMSLVYSPCFIYRVGGSKYYILVYV